MTKIKKSETTPMNFQSMSQADVPKGRNGKHKEIVSQLLRNSLYHDFAKF
jgi:hypothetical protein